MATQISCACGTVRIEADGRPMASVICHCTSCRTAGRGFDAQSGQAPIVDDEGGTPAVMWRKDKLRCVSGCERLTPHWLTPDSPTRRLVATCCGCPVALDFTKGFWLTVYRGRVADAPPAAMRVMVGDLENGTTLPDDGLPRMNGHSGRMMLKMMATWASMGFRRPKVAGIRD